MKNNGSLLPQISKILMFVFLTASTIFSQTTYYISNSQGNDSNIGTSETSPWKSLDKLHSSWNQIGPGDKILFKRGDEWAPSDIGGRVGVIQLPTAKNGSDGSPIVLDAYGSGDRPIISKQNVSGYSETIRGQSNAYFTFENLSFRGTVNFRTFDHAQGTHHITILNCDFQQAPMVFQGLYREDYTQLYPLHTIEIAYNTFYDNGHLTQDAISMANIPPGPRDGRKNVWVHHNQFYKIGEEAIDIGGGSGHVVEYNFISGTTTNGIKMHSQSSRLDSFVVRGNVILHVGMGVINGGFTDLPNPMSNGNALAFISTGHGKVYNNVISSRYCFTITESDQSAVTYGKMEDVEIFNNIFHGVTQISYVKSGTDAHGDYFGTNVWGTEPPLIDRGIVFKNNIYYPTTYEPGKLVRFWQMSGGSQQVNDAWTVTNANFQTAWVDRFNTIDEISDNPGFVNPTWASFYDYGDYSLQTSSPGIDAGVNITGYNIDIAGNPVPQGITTDIGAYEFNGIDLTPPIIVNVQLLNSTILLIEFSELLNTVSAENSNNYNISNSITINEATLSGNQVTLTTSEHTSGNYTVTATNILDLAGNVISGNNSAVYSLSGDTTPPNLLSADAIDGNTVELNFNEEVDQITAEDASNYVINGGGSGLRVWIDGDTANEIDDLFAITDVLMSPQFLVEGLSSAHYGLSGSGDVSASQSLNEDILSEMGLINYISHPQGAADKMVNASTPQNSSAAQEIVARANAGSANNKLLILVFGPATNVASALLMDPSIEDKIIVGFMGCTYNSSNLLPNDFNANNDLNSFNALINSNVEIQIMPGAPISSQLVFAKSTTATYLNGKGGIWQYLYNYWNSNYNGYANRTMWDVAIVEAIKDPSKTNSDIVSFGNRNDILVYSDIDETAMQSEFWNSVQSHQLGGTGCATLGSGGSVNVLSAVKSSSSKVTLSTSNHDLGSYTLVVNNVEDLSNNAIALNSSVSYSYDVDNISPVFTSISLLTPNSVKIAFSEKVKKSIAETISNYSISNGISIVSALLSASQKEVTLSTSEHTGGSYTIVINNIQDLAGNVIQANSTKQYSVEGDSVPPELASITKIDFNTIEVYFSEPINQSDAESTDNYLITNGIVVNSAVLNNSTKVTLSTTTHTAGDYTLTVSNVHDLAGNVITTNNSISYSYSQQTPGPELLYAYAPNNNIVEVAFSKSVSQSSAENIQNYSISDNINVTNATIKSSGDVVKLEVSELVTDFHYTLTVENIEDLEGNIISPDSNTTVFCFLNNPGPIALYDFTEGLNSNQIYDISCNGAPLHLTISNPSAITWLEGGGMSINSSVVISSDIAGKLNNNCRQTNALTIEAWIKPANTTQNGPARIVSLSNDAFNRNFTLGQGEGTNNTYGYDVRLRTTSTNNNGFPSVTASSPAVTTNLTHVVYTRNSEGNTKIYIDGVESLSINLGGNLSNWDDSFKLILANEMSGDRPWLGNFYKVAIYDKALDSDEVQTTFTEFNNTMLTNLRVFLEGPYNSGNMSTNLLDDQVIPLDQPYSAEPWNYDGYERVAEIPNDIVDWVLVEVRSDDTTIVAKRAAFLRKDGKVVDLNGISNVAFKDLASDEYYISIIHRNHLSILSAEKVNIGNHSQLLDMTKAENVFGSESVSDLGNGVFGMYAGDTNCSSIITYSDAMGIVQKNTKSGYNIADVNLSGIVTFADVTHVVNNNTKSANFKVNK